MLALVAVACGTRVRSDVPLYLRWRVDVVTHTRDGGDIDDGPVYVTAMLGRALKREVRMGLAVEFCSRDRDARTAACDEHAPPGTIVSSLRCGPDVWSDRLYCFDLVRGTERLELWRRVIEVPAVDGPPPPPLLIERERVAALPLGAATDVHTRRGEYRQIADPR